MHRRMLFLLPALTFAAAALLAGEAEPVDTLAKLTPTKLKIIQHGRGALLAEDFDADRWSADWLEPWVQDEALRVYCKDGKLRISGVTGRPVPVCADHHEFRFVGLVSKKFTQRDVVLACTMHVLAPLPEGETRVRYLSHLCGAMPDYFVDFGVSHEPDEREGWLYAPLADGYAISHDHEVPFLSLEEIPPDREHTLVLDHDSATKLTRAFIVDGDLWRPMGEYKLFLATTQAELKVDVPYDGVRVDVAYDDVRMYPRPALTPVRIVLLKPPFPFFPFPAANVALQDADGKVIGRARTDANGEATITLPADRLYPMGGEVVVTVGSETIGVATIVSRGVAGLYPGDVWVIFAPDQYKITDRGYPMGM